MRRNSLWVGIVEALAVVAVVTATSAYFLTRLPGPTAATMRSLSSVGVALLLAYVLEAVWMVSRGERDGERENWLGNACGIGLSGLLGIGIALAVAAHLEAGSAGPLDEIGLAWSIASFGLLGLLVVLHPFIADRLWKSVED